MTQENCGIVVFAFGTPATTQCNLHIAWLAKNSASQYFCPIYTQKEIFLGYENLDVTRIPGDEVPTLRICRGAVQWAKERGINRLHIICAKPHMKRCLRDMGKATKEAGLQARVTTSKEVGTSKCKEWFDPHSTQKRVRSARAWWPREVLLLSMPFWLYKRIAS